MSNFSDDDTYSVATTDIASELSKFAELLADGDADGVTARFGELLKRADDGDEYALAVLSLIALASINN